MNSLNLKKNVLVTGGAGGIGEAIVRKFHGASFNVAVHCFRSERKAEELCRELNAKNGSLTVRCYQADFTDPEAVVKMVSTVEKDMGPIDVLVNNAGLGKQRLITDTSYENWRETFAVNVDAAFLCSKSVLPAMIREKAGKIVNVSSMWGITGASCEVDYSASKAALIGFTKALAKEFGPSGINVNCVAPGVIDTKMNAHLSEDDLKELAYETPLGRLGTPAEIADAVYFLSSDESSFITGQVLSPNGGFVI